MAIVSNEYTIVFDEHAAAMKFAAAQLRHYLSIACTLDLTYNESGKNFISLGINPYSEKFILNYDLSRLKYEGFYTVCKNGNIYIFGRCDRGVIFGVYDFLEKFLGIKFLNIDCELVNPNQTLEVKDCNYITNPHTEQRIYLSENATCNPRMSLKYRFSSDYVVDDPLLNLHSLWYSIKGTPHNSIYYVPLEKYGETHPEFYCFNKLSGIYELCYTNGIDEKGEIIQDKKSVAMAVADSMQECMETAPEYKRYFMFGRQDDGLAICNCENCKNAREQYGGEAGILIVFLNAVLKELKRRYQKKGKIFDKYIVTFAYQATVKPPVDKNLLPISPLCVPDDHLCIRIAPSNADYTYALLDDGQKPDIKTQMLGWASLTKNMMVWDYTVNFSECYWYYPNLSYLKDNLEFYIKSGMQYILNQGAYNVYGSWQEDLKAYICSKLYWNCELEVSQLLDEYLVGYYGLASSKVRSYIDLMENYYLQKKQEGMHTEHLGKSQYELLSFKFTPLSLLEDGLKIIDSAIKDINDSALPEAEKQIYLDRLMLVSFTPIRMIILNADYYGEGIFDKYYKRHQDIVDKFELSRYGEAGYFDLYIVKGGTSTYFTEYRICLSEKPTKKEINAARYLQEKIFDLTGVIINFVTDKEVYPTNSEKAIMIGKNYITGEFFKQGMQVDNYEYYFDVAGNCIFIDSTVDIEQAVSKFVNMMLKKTAKGLKVFPYRRLKKYKRD